MRVGVLREGAIRQTVGWCAAPAPALQGLRVARDASHGPSTPWQAGLLHKCMRFQGTQSCLLARMGLVIRGFMANSCMM